MLRPTRRAAEKTTNAEASEPTATEKIERAAHKMQRWADGWPPKPGSSAISALGEELLLIASLLRRAEKSALSAHHGKDDTAETGDPADK